MVNLTLDRHFRQSGESALTLQLIENSLTQGFRQQKRAAVPASSRKCRYASAINTPPSVRSSFEGIKLRRGVQMKERYFGYSPRGPRQFGRLDRYKTKCLATEQPLFASELNRFEGIDLECRTFTFRNVPAAKDFAILVLIQKANRTSYTRSWRLIFFLLADHPTSINLK